MGNSCSRFLVSLMVVCLVLTGCSTKTKDNEQSGDQLGSATRTELILAVGAEPDGGFDPTTGWGRYGSPLFQSTLLKRNQELKLENDLATGYEVSSNGLEWTVKLREDVQFTDGRPLTAEDVAFTFQTAAASASALDLTNMAEVVVQDAYTVKFVLKQPQSTFVSLLVSTGIVPKHAYGQDYASKPIGSGPYKLVQWDRGQQLIVEANPEYYGSRPFFQKLTFLFLNEDAAFAAAKAGKVDIAYIPSAFSKQTVNGMKLLDVQTVDNRGIMFPYVPHTGEKTKDGYPIGNNVTSDPAIRKAVNYIIDRQLLVEGVLEGHGTPAYTVNDGLPWWNPDTVLKDGDLVKARQLLTEAGWLDSNGDGIVELGQQQAVFTLVYPASDITRQSLALAVADMVKPAGIQIQVEGKSWDDIKKMMHSSAVLFGWGSHDPVEMYHIYSSKYRGIDYFNTGFYSNSVVDGYMDRAMSAISEEEALQYWKKAQWDGTTGLSALGDAPWAWLVNINHLYLVKEQLDMGKQRIQPHGHGWPIIDNIEEWQWTN